MKKFYVVADVHGHYSEMLRDLKNAGYDSSDDNNLLVVIGDNFDRGDESYEIYKYLKELTDAGKAVVLHGNHEDFILSFLRGSDCSFNYLYNGFDKTLDSLLQQTDAFSMFCFYCDGNPDIARQMYGDRVEVLLGDFYAIPSEIRFDVFQEYAREEIINNCEGIVEWLESLPYYYETENYIFTHGGIDGSCLDWHKPEHYTWRELTWDNGSFWTRPIINTDKTVVVGHYHTDGIRDKYNIKRDKRKKSNQILYGDQRIYIDTCTILTKRVNVLIIEDNILEEDMKNESY